MPSLKVEVAPAIWEWIDNNFSFDRVDDKLSSLFIKWKKNEARPTFAQIERLSKKIYIPLGYFFLKAPPEEKLPVFEFRTVNSTESEEPSRNLIDTYYQMAAVQDWMRDYLRDQGNEQLPFVGSCKGEKNPENIAVSIRNITGMPIEWYTQSRDIKASFDTLHKLFENTGVLILRNGVVGQNNYRKLNVKEFRAFTIIDEYTPLIFINNNDTPAGKLFSLLHEAAHIWIGLHSFYNESSSLYFNINPAETLCNAIAAELLVPNVFFRNKWDNDGNTDLNTKIACVAGHFKCGKITIARRALDNNYIGRYEYENFVSKITSVTRNGGKNRNGGDYYNTAASRYGSRLILALDNSVREGRTAYTEAFRLTGTSRRTFKNLVSEIRNRA